jgi:hypothetical protein
LHRCETSLRLSCSSAICAIFWASWGRTTYTWDCPSLFIRIIDQISGISKGKWNFFVLFFVGSVVWTVYGPCSHCFVCICCQANSYNISNIKSIVTLAWHKQRYISKTFGGSININLLAWWV